MSLDHADLKRLKITRETRAWLTAECTRTGESAQEIARNVLHKVALESIDAARLLLALSPDNGHSGASEGHGGDSRGRRR